MAGRGSMRRPVLSKMLTNLCQASASQEVKAIDQRGQEILMFGHQNMPGSMCFTVGSTPVHGQSVHSCVSDHARSGGIDAAVATDEFASTANAYSRARRARDGFAAATPGKNAFEDDTPTRRHGLARLSEKKCRRFAGLAEPVCLIAIQSVVVSGHALSACTVWPLSVRRPSPQIVAADKDMSSFTACSPAIRTHSRHGCHTRSRTHMHTHTHTTDTDCHVNKFVS